MPGILSGHNDRIAWGLTNLGFDVQDLYMEKIDLRTGQYVFHGQIERARAERELISIKGQAAEELTTWVTRHGPIQEMNEVKQFAPLSMGWCINCHRTTKVNFPDSAGNNGNKFYSIYERYHKDLRTGKMDSVTVENIGGTDCQKCHY